MDESDAEEQYGSSELLQLSTSDDGAKRQSVRHGRGSVPATAAAAKPQRKGNRLERDLRDEIDAWGGLYCNSLAARAAAALYLDGTWMM